MELISSRGDLSEAYQKSAILQLGGELREPYPPDWPMIDRFFVYITYDRQVVSFQSLVNFLSTFLFEISFNYVAVFFKTFDCFVNCLFTFVLQF